MPDLCRNGHEKLVPGRCRQCLRDRQREYSQSPHGRAIRYRRAALYEVTPRGRLMRLANNLRRDARQHLAQLRGLTGEDV